MVYALVARGKHVMTKCLGNHSLLIRIIGRVQVKKAESSLGKVSLCRLSS